jgi:hypothetical protein
MSLEEGLERQLLSDRYKVAPEVVWHISQVRGLDGYERIDTMRVYGWTAIPSWGLEGWDLGGWPLVIIFHRDSTDSFELAYDVEGDVTVYRYPTSELRDAATDCLAFWHWKDESAVWVDGVDTIDTAPDRLRGRFSCERVNANDRRS